MSGTNLIVWNKYERYNNEPKHHPLDNSDIPCLVKMSDGEIWNAYWVIDFDYHNEPFTGWMFRSVCGDYYIWEEDDKDYKNRKIIAFAYMKDLNDIPNFPEYE